MNLSSIARTSMSGEGQSRIKVPIGPMLIKSIHDSYGTVLEMILELVQNAIDANARHIVLVINKKSRNITIIDDGDGVSKEKYEAALQSVMRTMKTRDKLGQFGMGMLSPLAKCEWHKLTSCPKGGDTYLEWTFNTKTIEGQMDDIYIPRSVRPEIKFATDSVSAPKGIRYVQWRTMVEIHKYTNDKFIGRVPSAQTIFDEIADKYREKMLENHVKISIRVVSERGEVDLKDAQAEPYYGHRLSDVRIYDEKAGMSTFRLLLARKDEKGAYIGQGVSVGEADNAFRFTFRSFARSVSGVLPTPIIEALNSGLFEGDVISECAKLHSDRKRFESGDALIGFCETIEKWYQDVGKDHYDAALDSRGAERYKMLGEDLKQTLEALINDPKFDAILKPFKGGAGLKASLKEKQETSDASNTKTPPSGEGKSTEEPDTKKQRRHATARSERLGLEIHYESIYDNKLWVYEPGVLTFNILHSKWRACEESQRRLKQLQELIAINVLMLQVMPEGDWRAHAESFVDEIVDPIIFLLQSSPNFQHISRKKGEGSR